MLLLGSRGGTVAMRARSTHDGQWIGRIFTQTTKTQQRIWGISGRVPTTFDMLTYMYRYVICSVWLYHRNEQM